jgi:hypothetical protein
MLEELLRHLGTGVTSIGELAREMGTTPGLVEVMLEELERRGLVTKVESCTGACQGCGVAGCLSSWRGRAWTLAVPAQPGEREEGRGESTGRPPAGSGVR